jgi:hypothetical protein
VICDEMAFWMDGETSTNPADEILAAVRPGLATTSGPLIAASSPHAKSGELYDAFRLHYGAQGDPAILVAKGTTREFNVTFSQAVVDRALLRDPAKNRAEYLAIFRDDVSAYVPRAAVLACVEEGCYERPRVPYSQYVAFVDCASGSGSDSMALCVAHRGSDERITIDAIREHRPPFSPAAAVAEYAALLKSYKITRVAGDKWGKGFVFEAFAQCGINYDDSAANKSEIYRDALGCINSGGVSLLDNERLVSQLVSLERSTPRGSNRDVIDHPRGGHDDVSNAVCGALVYLLDKRKVFAWWNLAGDTNDAAANERWRKEMYWSRYTNLIR